MFVTKTIEDVRAHRWAEPGLSWGLVPTMGTLHEGHLSLVRRARAENDRVGASIFVNPIQFDRRADLEAYPRQLERDCALLEAEGVDLVWAPDEATVYPPGFQTYVTVEEVTKVLEGAARPGHFRGVTTVVAKLFNVVQPTRAYFGQKDAQQALTIQRMVIDLNFPVEVVVCPIVREGDGLAMSSRNRNIPREYRARALALREALLMGRDMIHRKEYDAMTITNAMAQHILRDREIELDYLDIVSPESLENVEKVDDLVLMAGAIKIGGVRLIDNILVGPNGPWSD